MSASFQFLEAGDILASMSLSWLGLLNFLILQWFCVRLAKIQVTDAPEPVIGWTMLRWPLPLTGWWSPYVWIR